MNSDDRIQFEQEQRERARAMSADPLVADEANKLLTRIDRYNWSYQWSWLGLPIIQLPTDVVAIQEVIWRSRPQLIIETGIARGGSLLLSASILAAIGEGYVLGVDIDIRPHNRVAIQDHPLSNRIQLIEGSSTSPAVLNSIRQHTARSQRTMVILDSNHSHVHVAEELSLYSSLVTTGQYLIVSDTVVELLPTQTHRGPRPWGPGNNPMTALTDFLQSTTEFVVDEELDAKLVLTSSPRGYLRRVPSKSNTI